MPSPLTTVTELGTGLGMLGYASVDEALAARPPTMVSMAPETWANLRVLREGKGFEGAFEAAFANGEAFLRARDGLRGRVPLSVEWKGSQRAPGDEVAPIDLRVDHVYLVSCKYLSKILCNASPSHLFDELLAGRHGRRSADWYATVAPDEYGVLYGAVRAALGSGGSALPGFPGDLGREDRRRLGQSLRDGWPGDGEEAYAALIQAVGAASAARWTAALARRNEREAMLWRLLRMGSAPYFVLGVAGRQPLRLRIATPWDWRQRYRSCSFEVAPQPGGQPRVGWRATVAEVATGRRIEIRGHVEVRWSHGRFGGLPEAKVYLDTPHQDVPGYVPLT